MPKRKDCEKIEKYLKKIRRIEEKRRRRSKHRSRSRSLSNREAGRHSDADLTPERDIQNQDAQNQDAQNPEEIQPQVEQDPEMDPSEMSLDPETLQALGKPIKEKEKFGPNINGDLAKLWAPILKNGLDDPKEKQCMLEKYLIPNNCQLLQAPKLNPEIIATVSDSIRNRDKKIEEDQQQLGHGLTALNRALSLLATNTGERAVIINTLSEASQILCDLHFGQTVVRRRLITPILDKKFLDIVKEADRDDYLYGNDLAEKIKAMKYAQKSSHSIKKNVENYKQYKKPASQGNYKGPPRYQNHKYSRSGPKRPDKNHQYPHYKNYSQAKKSKPETKTARK